MRRLTALCISICLFMNMIAQIRLEGTTKDTPMALEVGKSYLFPTNFKVAYFTFVPETDGVLYLNMSERLRVLGINENVSGNLPQFGNSSVLGVEAHKIYKFQNDNTWGKSVTMDVAFVAGNPFLPVQSTNIIPEEGSVYRTTEKDGNVSFYFNVEIDASKAEAYVLLKNGKTVHVQDIILSEDYNTQATIYIVKLADVYNQLLDEGDLKEGETFQVVLKNVVDRNNAKNKYDGEIVVNYLASARATRLTNVSNVEVLKSYYYPGSDEGLIELTFSEEVTCETKSAILSYGDREKNTWTEIAIPYIIKGNVIILNLQGISMDDVPVNDDGLRYANISLKNICDKEGYPVEGNAVGSIGTVSLSFQVELVDVELYKVTYILDGNVYKSQEIAVGEPITPPDVVVGEGYLFNGWQNVPDVMPAEKLTIYGTTSTKQYQVTYILDGTVYKIDDIEYGKKLLHPAVPPKEGYTFEGWECLLESMPARDLTINGKYVVNSYSLVYMVDGLEYKRMEIAYGTPLEPEPIPSKIGHTFSGWSELPETMPAGNLTIVGNFMVNSYSLVYVLDGLEYKRMEIAYGTPLEPEPMPSKIGHTFSGWSELPETMPAGNLTIVGNFMVNSYSLVYVLDGLEYKRMEIAYGTLLEPEPMPSKIGHTFSGWSELPETMPAEDLVIQGSFQPNIYTVTYILEGEIIGTKQVVFGASVPLLEVPQKTGYLFAGWGELPAVMPACDLIVHGTYVIDKEYIFDLIYMIDGKEYKRSTVLFGSIIEPEPFPEEKEGYTFSGWSEIPGTMPFTDIVVNGSYIVNSYVITYFVDNILYASDSINYGDEVIPLEYPNKVGHTFSGWSELPATMPANDIIAKGEYIKNEYQLIYLIDGEPYATELVAYGDTIKLLDIPAKEGCIFSGWSDIPETMPDADVYVIGSFKVDVIENENRDLLVDVFTLQGVLVATSVEVNELREKLSEGVYVIVGGKYKTKISVFK